MGDELDLDVIEARALAATPGPWRATLSRTLIHVASALRGVVSLSVSPPRVPEREIREGHVRRAYADAAFIAHARTDIPALVAEVRRLREERDALVSAARDAVAAWEAAPERSMPGATDGALARLQTALSGER